MATLNIPSSVEDPSYRYTMPRIISKKEGRGNGSKTGIMNMGEVARAIKRDPMYLTKFFGYELCAQAKYTNKEGEGERAVINGHHDAPIFQKLVDDFIEKYVLCMDCHLPEIDMVVNKKGLVVATCKACGWKGALDNRHKLATFISKNPPSSGIGFEQKQEGGYDDAHSFQPEDEKVAAEGEKHRKEKKEKKEKKSKKEKTRDKDEEEELRYDDEIMSGVINDLVDFVKKNEKITVDEMYEEVRAQQVTKYFDNKLRMFAVISAFFPNGTLSAKGVENHSKFIEEFIANGRLPFAEWIWGFEAYLAANPSATKAWAMSLKALYDADLAEEEQILEYYKGQNDSPGFDASRKAAAPFIKWLETSEESSDDGER